MYKNKKVSLILPSFNEEEGITKAIEEFNRTEIIDEIIAEPLGGAHRDKNLILENLKKSIKANLDEFKTMSAEEIISTRKNHSKGFKSVKLRINK